MQIPKYCSVKISTSFIRTILYLVNIIYVRVLAPVNVTRKLFVNKQFVVCFIYKSYICDWMVYSARIFVSKQIMRNLLDERSIIKSWNMAKKMLQTFDKFWLLNNIAEGMMMQMKFYYLKVYYIFFGWKTFCWKISFWSFFAVLISVNLIFIVFIDFISYDLI